MDAHAQVDEGLSLSDTGTPSKLTSQSLSESLCLADEANRHPIFQGISADGLGFGDALSMALIYVLAINDNLGLVDEGQVAVEGSVEPEDGLFMNAQASAYITAMCKAIGAFDGLRRAGRRERCR